MLDMKLLLSTALLMLIWGPLNVSCTFETNVVFKPMSFSTWIEDATNRLRQLGVSPHHQTVPKIPPLSAVAPRRANQNIRMLKPPDLLDDLPKDNELKRNLAEESSSCFAEDTGIQGRDFQVIQDCPSATACQDHCYANVHCQHFSYSTTLLRCFLYDIGTGVRSSLGLVSGPKVCPSALEEATTEGSPQDAAANSGSSPCFVSDIRLEGTRIRLVNEIAAALACQRVCTYIENCAYFNFDEQSSSCELLSDALNVAGGPGLISGPRSCELGSGAVAPAVLSASQLASSQLMEDAKQVVVPEAYNPPSKEPQGSIEQFMGGQSAQVGSGSNPTRLFGDLFSRGLETGTGLLSGILGGQSSGGAKLLEGQQLESLAAGAGQAFGVLTNLMAAGDTVMKTLPIQDMVRAGANIAQSRNVNRNSGSSPPVGVGRPEVTCLTEGMRCCVPRTAAPKYQSDPPRLNGVNSPRCSANYVSAWDQLCATIRFDDDECNTSIFETAELVVYRARMEMPGNMNDAFCECSIVKSSTELEAGEQRISGSSNWEYSLALQEEEEANRQRFQQSVGSLSKAAKAALTWGDVLLGNPSASAVTPSGGRGSAIGFLDTIINLSEEISPGTAGGASANEDFAPGSGALLDALASLQNSNIRRQRALRQLFTVPEPALPAEPTTLLRASGKIDPQPLRSVPMDCAYWEIASCEDANSSHSGPRKDNPTRDPQGFADITRLSSPPAACTSEVRSPKMLIQNECPAGDGDAAVNYSPSPSTSTQRLGTEEERLSIRLEVQNSASSLGVVCTYRLAPPPGQGFAYCPSSKGNATSGGVKSVRGGERESHSTTSSLALSGRQDTSTVQLPSSVTNVDRISPVENSESESPKATTKAVSFSIDLPSFPHGFAEYFQNGKLLRYSTLYQINFMDTDALGSRRLLSPTANAYPREVVAEVKVLAILPL